MRHFVRDVLPLVRQEIPSATFQVVGVYPTAEVLQLHGGAVVVHGQVADMAPHFRETSVVVVPLLHGGGTRLKILEAAASGKAIVTTTLGMEGLDFRPGEDLLVADTPIEFAQAVVGLLRDPEHRRRLGRQAHREARRYDWDASGEGLLRIVEEVARPGADGRQRLASNGWHVPPSSWNSSIHARGFLVGCPRSGTTLLQSLLAAHPRMTSFPESHFFTSLVPDQPQLCTRGIAARRARHRFQQFVTEIGRPELRRHLPGRAHRIRQHVKVFVNLLDSLTLERGKDRWVEKTPDHLHVVSVIEQYLPSASSSICSATARMWWRPCMK